MIFFVIPARYGSKGFPEKNRILFHYCADTMRPDLFKNEKKVIVTTDDIIVQDKARQYGYDIIERNSKLCTDESSMKDVLLDVIDKKNMNDLDIIVLLYLTYPGRTWKDIDNAVEYFLLLSANSLLCKKRPQSDPHLCMYEHDRLFGRQVIKHNLHRRQDYKKTFEISHFIGVFYAGEVSKLNNNLYNDETVFMPIRDVIDIDTEHDYCRWLESCG